MLIQKIKLGAVFIMQQQLFDSIGRVEITPFNVLFFMLSCVYFLKYILPSPGHAKTVIFFYSTVHNYSIMCDTLFKQN